MRSEWGGRGIALCFALLALASPGVAQELPGLLGEEKPEAPAQIITTEHSAATDRALEKRLREIYLQVDGLEALVVEAEAGVLRVSGEVLSSSAREKALGIARQLQGVVEVQDEITEARDLERRLRPIAERLRKRGLDLAANLPLLAVSLLAFVLIWGLGRLVASWEAPFRRLTPNDFARELLRQAVRFVFFVGGVVAALQILDATAVVAAVAGVAGLVGLALSFAFRDLAENYIASVLLSLRQPFLANEVVSIDGHQGRVVRLTSRATILIDADGNHLRIPNAAVFKATILNYSRNPRRRFGFDVGVASDTDLGAAIQLGVETLERMPGILDDPVPAGWVDALRDWDVSLRFVAWIDQAEADFVKARGEAMRLVKEAYDAVGISMPEPILNLQGAAEAAARAAAGRSAAPASVERASVELVVDITPTGEIEQAVAEDRARAESDLLDDSRSVE